MKSIKLGNKIFVGVNWVRFYSRHTVDITPRERWIFIKIVYQGRDEDYPVMKDEDYPVMKMGESSDDKSMEKVGRFIQAIDRKYGGFLEVNDKIFSIDKFCEDFNNAEKIRENSLKFKPGEEK